MSSMRAVSWGVLMWCVASQSFATSKRVEFSVQPQSLHSALDAWALQSGWQFVAPAAAIRSQGESPGVVGTLTAREGLQQVLANSSLRFELVSERTVSLRDGAAVTSAATLASWEPVLAAAAVAPTAPLELQDTRAVMRLDEIVVTGTRLKDTREGPARVTVFNRERLDQLGAATLGDMLRYVSEQPYALAPSFTTSGAQFVELRGLGLGSTLVLINGRRVTPSAADIAANAFDLNMIPMTAVERVEVLAESASAVYGTDAMGGVLNVVLKQDLSRPAVELRYGSAEGGAEERRASVSLGVSGERGHVSLVLDALDRDLLVGRERPAFGNQDFRRFGWQDRRSPNSNPGNISARGGNLPGVGAPMAAVPEGTDGIGLTPADFIATAGQRRLTSLNEYRTIVPAAERMSAMSFGELRLSPALTVFADLLYVDRLSDYQIEPASLSGTAVPATNAFNPFGVTVSANYLFEGLGPRHIITESELARGTLGVRGDIGTWEWEVSALRSVEDGTRETRNGVHAGRVAAALASNDPATALNVFQDGPGASPSLLRSLIAAPTTNEYQSVGTLANAFVRGALFALPGGDVEAVIGGEWREEEIEFKESYSVLADRTVSAAFAEVRIPLIGASMDVPGVDSLSLTAAARYDEYDDFGHTLNPQVGVTWWFAPALMLRASYGTGFRAPSLFELHTPRVQLPLTFVDPRRNNEVVEGIGIAGGNPDLDPIESTFTTAGIVWLPTEDARISLDFFRIRLDERVAFFSEELVLANEGRYPERVVRAVPSPADLAAGWPGRIESVDITRINFGTLATRGIDVEASWAFDTAWGQFTPLLSATWLDQYDTVDLPQTPVTGHLDRARSTGTITRWRGVASIGWSHRGMRLAVTARHTPSYADVDSTTDALNGRTIDATTLFDVQASVELGELFSSDSAWLRGTKFSAGLINAFDKGPQFSAVAVNAGYDTTQGDLRQRFGYAQLTKRF